MKLLQEGQLDENVINQYKNLAKINGYVIKDEDGKSQGDLESLLMSIFQYYNLKFQ